jgi:hypothetical protein
MNLISKEILMSHLQRSEGAEEVSLPIDFFRDLLYQAMPRTWVGLTMQDVKVIEDNAPSIQMAIFMAEATLKDKNNGNS